MTDEIKPNKLADRLSKAAAVATFVGTIGFLAVALPLAGMWAVGMAAFHAGGALLAVLGAAGGCAAGLVPLLALASIGKDKTSTDLAVRLSRPAQVVDEAVNCLLSPRYGWSKLKARFAAASEKPAQADTPGKPEPVPPPPAPRI